MFTRWGIVTLTALLFAGCSLSGWLVVLRVVAVAVFLAGCIPFKPRY